MFIEFRFGDFADGNSDVVVQKNSGVFQEIKGGLAERFFGDDVTLKIKIGRRGVADNVKLARLLGLFEDFEREIKPDFLDDRFLFHSLPDNKKGAATREPIKTRR